MGILKQNPQASPEPQAGVAHGAIFVDENGTPYFVAPNELKAPPGTAIVLNVIPKGSNVTIDFGSETKGDPIEWEIGNQGTDKIEGMVKSVKSGFYKYDAIDDDGNGIDPIIRV